MRVLTAVTPYLLPPEPVTTFEQYRTLGGGDGLAAARRLGPAQTVKELGLSGLRGRGGAGFPTGRKWATVREAPGAHHYAVCNAAEGEPATFKDRAILRANPYQVVEGLVIAAETVDAVEAFVGIKGRFEREVEALTRALEEMEAAGLTGDLPVRIVLGPDEYLFGEEKALLEVIEGRPPLPRLFPPFEHGLFATAPQTGWESHEPEPGHAGREESNPTLVNNVETLANVAHVMARGAEWFRSMGTAESPGHVVATVVGDVARPGVGEVALGTPLSQVIAEVGGGPRPGRHLKAAFSGVANPVLTADRLDTPLAYETMQAAGTGMGAAGYVVYDETACMVDVAYELSRFLAVESCGQCPPCKLGSTEITDRLARVAAGGGGDDDVEAIGGWLRRVTDGNRCYLAVQEQLVVGSILRAFPEEFAAHIEQGRCPIPDREAIAVPKLLDLGDGQARYDERHLRKLPDWTYADDGEGGA